MKLKDINLQNYYCATEQKNIKTKQSFALPTVILQNIKYHQNPNYSKHNFT